MKSINIHELHYSNTNTYLIEGPDGCLLFDTGWAGTFPAFCRALGETVIALQKIDFILISHFHPDHMGIAQEIADHGAVILIPDVQKDHIHDADGVFEKDGFIMRPLSGDEKSGPDAATAYKSNAVYVPISDEKVRHFSLDESRDILKEIGIDGEIFHTPGHSDDSISLLLDDGSLFVGDLNPLYELELHKGTKIGQSWDELLSHAPKTVYYGHAKTAVLSGNTNSKTDSAEQHDSTDDSGSTGSVTEEGHTVTAGKSDGINLSVRQSHDSDKKNQALVSRITKYIDRGYGINKIQKKTGADPDFIEDVVRMYLTHQNVSVQGILDRIEIKNR